MPLKCCAIRTALFSALLFHSISATNTAQPDGISLANSTSTRSTATTSIAKTSTPLSSTTKISTTTSSQPTTSVTKTTIPAASTTKTSSTTISTATSGTTASSTSVTPTPAPSTPTPAPSTPKITTTANRLTSTDPTADATTPIPKGKIPPVVFIIVGIVVGLILIVVAIAIILLMRRPRAPMTGLENFLVSNEGVGTLNGNGTQVPLMDSSYDNSSDLRQQEDTGNSEYLSRAVVKYRFEANEDYKDQMSVEKDDQLLVKEKYEDGWWLVQKETTNEEGIVPGSYCHDIAANRRPSEPFIGAQTS